MDRETMTENLSSGGQCEFCKQPLGAADEIERLQKGWESLEWESKQEIERLRAKCNQRRDDLAQAREILDERFKEIERLQATVEYLQDQCKEKHDSMIAMMNEALELRGALERIVNEPWNAGKGGWAQKIAREACAKPKVTE